MLQTLTWALAGLLIASKRPHNRFGWVFCAASLTVAVSALGHEYAVYALVPPGHELPAGEWVLWLASWSWVLYVGVVPVVLLVFPHGQLLSRRWAPVLALTVVATSALLLSRVLRPGSMVGEASTLAAVRNPVGIPGWGPALAGVQIAAKWLLALVLVAGVVSLLLRSTSWPRARPPRWRSSCTWRYSSARSPWRCSSTASTTSISSSTARWSTVR